MFLWSMINPTFTSKSYNYFIDDTGNSSQGLVGINVIAEENHWNNKDTVFYDKYKDFSTYLNVVQFKVEHDKLKLDFQVTASNERRRIKKILTNGND